MYLMIWKCFLYRINNNLLCKVINLCNDITMLILHTYLIKVIKFFFSNKTSLSYDRYRQLFCTFNRFVIQHYAPLILFLCFLAKYMVNTLNSIWSSNVNIMD